LQLVLQRRFGTHVGAVKAVDYRAYVPSWLSPGHAYRWGQAEGAVLAALTLSAGDVLAAAVTRLHSPGRPKNQPT